MLLVQVAQEVLQDSRGVEALLRCWEETGQAALAELEEIRAGLQSEPEAVRAAVAPEAQAVEESFQRLEQVAGHCHLYAGDFERAHLEALIADLPQAARCLELDMLRLQEALWLVRGPSAHAGINRILHHPEERERECEVESQRLALWLDNLAEVVPPAFAEAARAWGAEAQAWLADSRTALPEWQQTGLQLGNRYADCDPQFLWRVYSGSPTPFGLLNVAVQAAHLLEQGLLGRPMVEFYLGALRDELALLREGQGALLKEASATLQDWGRDIQEIARELDLWLAKMERWVAADPREPLEPIREMAWDLADELYEFLGTPPAAEPPPDCPVCGLAARSGEARCSACGSLLRPPA